MRGDIMRSGERGSILFMVMVLSMALAFGVTILLHQGEVEAKATRVRVGAVRALYEAYGELEKAKTVIGEADYNTEGHNLAVQAALLQSDHKIAGTDVEVIPMTGATGTWYRLSARIPYADNYERVVNQAFREIDFFSSYNLFVADDPAGISGSPVGAIHTNDEVQFYFPGGVYRHSVTAVNGEVFKSGATVDNTNILGPFNPNAARVDIDYEGSDRYSLNFIETNTDASLNFDASLNTRLTLFIRNGEQWVRTERWTKPTVEDVTYQQLVGYNAVNPHEVTYEYVEQVSQGFETRTRDVSVFDHYDTVMESSQTPVYVDDTRDKQVPVYTTVEDTQQVPVYRDEERTKTETQMVWVAVDSSSGGTTVGGDDGSLGYWAPQEVTVTYTVKVLDHYDTVPFTYQVIDHYDTVTETYQRLDHYDTVETPTQVAVYRTETETYDVEIFQDVTKTGTKTVYDQEPIYETRTETVYTPSSKVSTTETQVPENGLIFSASDILSLKGELIDRVTVASRGSVTVSGNLVYKDQDGDNAYLNGDKPWLPYEPNPDYDNHAILGIIAQNDVLYGRDMPDNTEINASMLAITGRVGIEGITLDDNGEVLDFNQIKDEFGRVTGDAFSKNSIRRLGGITTARRPVETVVRSGSIVSGFNVGQSVFDVGLLEGPPPFFLAYPTPRFFATMIEK